MFCFLSVDLNVLWLHHLWYIFSLQVNFPFWKHLIIWKGICFFFLNSSCQMLGKLMDMECSIVLIIWGSFALCLPFVFLQACSSVSFQNDTHSHSRHYLSVFDFDFIVLFTLYCFDSCLKTDIQKRTPDFTQILQFYNLFDHNSVKKCIVIIVYFSLFYFKFRSLNSTSNVCFFGYFCHVQNNMLPGKIIWYPWNSWD